MAVVGLKLVRRPVSVQRASAGDGDTVEILGKDQAAETVEMSCATRPCDFTAG